jgi:hypothetical protein
MQKDYAFPCWTLCVGALVRVEGCPGVGFGLESINIIYGQNVKV